MVIKDRHSRASGAVVGSALFLLLAVCLVAGCSARSESDNRIRVAASIVPVADFCRNVGGDLVEVRSLIPAQAGCGHTFEPTVGQIKFLADADVFVINGLGLESWASDVVSKVGNPKQVTMVASDSIPRRLLLPTGDADLLSSARKGENVYDPHVWLDPSLAIYEVEAIRDCLGRVDPVHRAQYTKNAAAYIEKLKALDAKVAVLIAPARRKEFVATHPTWTYFARRYGVVQAGEVEELPGKEPSLAQINLLMDKVRDLGIKAVFAEPQLSPKAVEVIAQDAGPRVKVFTVDPVGDPENPAVATYVKLMERNAAIICEAMK